MDSSHLVYEEQDKALILKVRILAEVELDIESWFNESFWICHVYMLQMF